MGPVLALLLAAAPARAEVTLIGFADYHSHAMPFHSEGRPGQAGLARAIAYLDRARSRPGTLVVSGGDMLNHGAPAWSDEYRCRDWGFLRGRVDAMAVGNHDLDYGWQELTACREESGIPLLSANLVGADGAPLFGPGSLLQEVAGVRIGLFALAGPDVQRLVRREQLPAGARFEDATATAARTVRRLRQEGAAAVVLIGHQSREEDEALARAVPGIDVILGSHSHWKGELQRIAGTATWFISPYQYLSYLAELRLRFLDGRLAGVAGGLVRMDERQPQDPAVAEELSRWQARLQAARPERFQVLGRASSDLDDAGAQDGECVLGNWVTDLLRRAAGSHVFFSTASSFRGAIPAGEVTEETLLLALPYANEVVSAELTGAQLREWLAYSVSRLGSDAFSQASGIRYAVRDGQPVGIEVLAHPAAEAFVPIDPKASYRVATTDYQAFLAEGYKSLFAKGLRRQRGGLDVHAVLRRALRSAPATAARDGRVRRLGEGPHRQGSLKLDSITGRTGR